MYWSVCKGKTVYAQLIANFDNIISRALQQHFDLEISAYSPWWAIYWGGEQGWQIGSEDKAVTTARVSQPTTDNTPNFKYKYSRNEQNESSLSLNLLAFSSGFPSWMAKVSEKWRSTGRRCEWQTKLSDVFQIRLLMKPARSAGFSRIKKIPYQAPPTQLGPRKCTFWKNAFWEPQYQC